VLGGTVVGGTVGLVVVGDVVGLIKAKPDIAGRQESSRRAASSAFQSATVPWFPWTAVVNLGISTFNCAIAGAEAARSCGSSRSKAAATERVNPAISEYSPAPFAWWPVTGARLWVRRTVVVTVLVFL
jgi:hypothetical protein